MHYRPGKGGWECTAWVKYAIYDCLVYFKFCSTSVRNKNMLVCLSNTSVGNWTLRTQETLVTRHFGVSAGAEESGQFGSKTLRHQDILALVRGHFGTHFDQITYCSPQKWGKTLRQLGHGQDSSALWFELLLGHFGTSADPSGQFGPTKLVLKCPESEVSWVQSVRNS